MARARLKSGNAPATTLKVRVRLDNGYAVELSHYFFPARAGSRFTADLPFAVSAAAKSFATETGIPILAANFGECAAARMVLAWAFEVDGIMISMDGRPHHNMGLGHT
jgi:hypothetical protein